MRFTILQKGLLVIAIPILVEAVLFGVLIRTQTERDRDLLWAVHTKEVIARVEAIYRRLLEGTAAVRVAGRLCHTGRQPTRFGTHSVELPDQIAELKRLVADNPRQQSRIDQLAAESQALIDWQAPERRVPGRRAEQRH